MPGSLAPPPAPDACELCGREDVPLTRHHLIPRTLHGKKRMRKRYSREEMVSSILWLCRPCHSHIHRLFDERTLAEQYATREALLAHPDVQAFVAWLSDKPAGFKPKSHRGRRR
ncbi:hypothetical protein [Phytohalomonas tamaricis]|uniref:hypothetical protein n=1 Tax=Phytohalomonas tamaricis TaxID=2081032 RepID=UPI000D0AC0C8|nr:hypothetical protein [Phytohalomonas tamaricis]